MSNSVLGTGVVSAQSAPLSMRLAWASRSRSVAAFVLLVAGYALSFSFDSGDALDAARWMQSGEIHRLVEFRHLVQRLLPFWLWQGLRGMGLGIEPLTVLRGWDMVTAAAAVMLLYRLLRDITGSRVASFLGSFLFATSHCFWGYAGSGRLYSTSMLLAIAAYYLAWHVPRLEGSRRWMAVGAAATLVCFAALFWLVHIFNAAGVGVLLLLQPMRVSWPRRAALVTAFALTGTVVALAAGVSALRFGNIPLTITAVQVWISDVGTPPTQFDRTSPMKAAYGQAHGILAQPGLPFMINGLLRKDPELIAVGSLPWQLGKFAFVGVLLLLVYVYPWVLVKRADSRKRALILSLFVPLLTNLYFALSWLGGDRQRFLPAMVSIVALGALSVLDVAERLGRARAVTMVLSTCLVFIAGVNFAEVLLPSQRQFLALEAEYGPLKRLLRPVDLTVDFGKDIDYQAAILDLSGAPFITLSNDVTRYEWDHPDWQDQFTTLVTNVRQRGGRVFVIDRLAVGFKPVEAAWSEKQHPKPTVKEFAQFLRSAWCVEPALDAGRFQYYELRPRQAGCSLAALQPFAEAAR